MICARKSNVHNSCDTVQCMVLQYRNKGVGEAEGGGGGVGEGVVGGCGGGGDGLYYRLPTILRLYRARKDRNLKPVNFFFLRKNRNGHFVR